MFYSFMPHCLQLTKLIESFVLQVVIVFCVKVVIMSVKMWEVLNGCILSWWTDLFQDSFRSQDSSVTVVNMLWAELPGNWVQFPAGADMFL